MYSSNLSWKPLTQVLNTMMEQKLITSEELGSHITYKITKKGTNVLNYFHEAMQLIEIK
jgi:predicted transcriptional regulator